MSSTNCFVDSDISKALHGGTPVPEKSVTGKAAPGAAPGKATPKTKAAVVANATVGVKAQTGDGVPKAIAPKESKEDSTQTNTCF